MRTLAMWLAAGLAASLVTDAARGQFGGSMGGGAGFPGRNSGNGNAPFGDSSSIAQRTQYLTGRVVLSDGAALPEPAKIERVCTGASRVVAYTDLKGRFSFNFGQSQELADASQIPGTGPATRGAGNRPIFDCELRISLPGFRIETLPLSDSRYLDNPDLGTIILRRIANVEGLTISATSALAPKDAKKAYEKGLESAGKKNPAEARKDFEKAVEIYPRYAAAWFELGRLSEEKEQFDDARKSYGQAVGADAKYIPPHERLAWIGLREQKWQEVAENSDAILRLDPIDYPDAYYLNGVGNFQLGNLEAAEKSTREALTRDTTHKNVRTPYLLGLILAQKGDYADAVPLLRAFLEQNPDVSDAATIREQLSSIEQAAKQQHP